MTADTTPEPTPAPTTEATPAAPEAAAPAAEVADASTEDKPTEVVDLRNLQDKFHGLLDQRNHYNDLARESREARNLLNDQRREKSEELESLKGARDAANEKMRAAKEIRNGYQDQAKALIAQKKGQKGAIERSLPLQVRKLRSEIEAALERQETQVLSVEKERDLIDEVRRKRQELKQKEAEMGKQAALEVDLDDTDKAIDDLFQQADVHHATVVELNKEAKGHHDKFVATIKEIRVIQAEANEKHQAFVTYRKKADDLHGKAMELREKVMAVKGERRDQWQARKQEMRDVNDRAHRNVNDPKAIEKANESALDQLKKGGKISLGF